MRTILPDVLERGRVTSGEYSSHKGYGPYGAFVIPSPIKPNTLRIIAAGANYPMSDGWEHVSVSLEHRTPTWSEMVFVKDLFWSEHELVIQFHPPKQDYVNFHPYCLHLWKSLKYEIKLPPALLIGPMGK
jgi:hypothetical protein